MSFRRKDRRSAELNIAVTPLIDVVLVLLIFFMVSTTFKHETRVHLKLPDASGQEAPAPEEPTMIRVAIDVKGHYYVDDEALVQDDLPTLVRALKVALGARSPLPVLIQADANATHQAVMTAMDAASQAGLTQITFAATQPDHATP